MGGGLAMLYEHFKPHMVSFLTGLQGLLRLLLSSMKLGKLPNNARTEMESKSPYWWPDLQMFVAITIIGLYAMVVILLLLKPMPITGEAGTLLTALTGLLTGKVATIVDFYFGTSKSSALKDEAAKTQAQTISALAAPEKVSVVGTFAGGHNTGETK